jgi:hypothetical protein
MSDVDIVLSFETVEDESSAFAAILMLKVAKEIHIVADNNDATARLLNNSIYFPPQNEFFSLCAF